MDDMIAQLNRKENISSITLSGLEDANLSEEEKLFIRTYQPQKGLIIYGSLAPGRPNHSKVEHIKGTWKKGIIRGRLESKGWGAQMGYNGFRHAPAEEQEIINAFILLSDELADHWPLLDEFEGREYSRLLAKYELENGETGVGYIYALAG